MSAKGHKYERAVCPICGRMVPVNKDGQFRMHGRIVCPGSKTNPPT